MFGHPFEQAKELDTCIVVCSRETSGQYDATSKPRLTCLCEMGGEMKNQIRITLKELEIEMLT